MGDTLLLFVSCVFMALVAMMLMKLYYDKFGLEFPPPKKKEEHLSVTSHTGSQSNTGTTGGGTTGGGTTGGGTTGGGTTGGGTTGGGTTGGGTGSCVNSEGCDEVCCGTGNGKPGKCYNDCPAGTCQYTDFGNNTCE